MQRNNVRQPLLGGESAPYRVADVVPVIVAIAPAKKPAAHFSRLSHVLKAHILSFLGACYVNNRPVLLVTPMAARDIAKLANDFRDICSFAAVSHFTHSLMAPFSYRVIDFMRPTLAINCEYQRLSAFAILENERVAKIYKRTDRVVGLFALLNIAASVSLCYYTFQQIAPVDTQGMIFISMAILGAVSFVGLCGIGLQQSAAEDDLGNRFNSHAVSSAKIVRVAGEFEAFKITLLKLLKERSCLHPSPPRNYLGYPIQAFNAEQVEAISKEFAAGVSNTAIVVADFSEVGGVGGARSGGVEESKVEPV